MLYHLFQYLESFDFPGAGVFQYITFRSACAIILSLIIASVVGKRVIRMLQRQQIGEEIRDLGLQGQMEKKGTPASPATAFASRVLPVPGGPTSRTPLGSFAPMAAYFCGSCR